MSCEFAVQQTYNKGVKPDLIMYRVEVKNSPYQNNQWKYNNNSAYYLIEYAYSVDVKLLTDLVNKPCKSEPPHESATENANIAYRHLQGMVGDDKIKLGKWRHKQKKNKRIWEC